jgi:hypothetical protein
MEESPFFMAQRIPPRLAHNYTSELYEPITSYSKATHSASFSLNHFSAASSWAKHLWALFVANFGAGVDVDENGFHFRLPRICPVSGRWRFRQVSYFFRSWLSEDLAATVRIFAARW